MDTVILPLESFLSTRRYSILSGNPYISIPILYGFPNFGICRIKPTFSSNGLKSIGETKRHHQELTVPISSPKCIFITDLSRRGASFKMRDTPFEKALPKKIYRSSVCTFAMDYSPGDDASYERLKVGSPVMITEAPPFLKVVEPMPMMCPNRGVVMSGDVGRIIRRKPKDVWVVRVKAGAFLLDQRYFKLIEEQS
ncbi:hypothetical protein KP509_12G061600 [Ceratopteris richardii]|uniref:DUF3148 domain-containing protein n=1 Tax=Ceratopteris richardii TaxID=49495 RepID=A0A8T2TMD3_CERRI|nr:hypothetical protein KP509_12G061600 [Ceratopteris richardii]